MPANPRPPDPEFSFHKIAVAAFGPSLLFGTGKGAILPVIALSARDAGASTAMASFIVGLIGIGSLFSNIPASLIISRYGERRSLVGAALVSVIGLALCLLPTSIWLLAVGIFCVGMAQSVFFLARQTYVLDIVPGQYRARAMSTLGGMMRIGVFFGPFLGAGLMHFIGLAGAYWVALAMMLGTGILSATIPDASPGTNSNPNFNACPSSVATPKANRGKPGLWGIAMANRTALTTTGLGIVCVSGIRASRQIIIPLWAASLGLAPAAISIIFGLVAAIDMFMFYPAGKIMDRMGRRWAAIPSTLIMGTAMLCIPLTTGLVSFVIVAMAIGLGNGMGSGLVMTLGADAAPDVGRTRFLGIWRLISDVGASGTPLLLAGIMTLAPLALAAATVGGMGYAAAAIFARWLPRRV